MHISEPRFNELRMEAALAQGVEAPAASAPRQENDASTAVDVSTAVDAALAREQAYLKAKILQSEWPEGLVKSEDNTAPFIWYGTLQDLAKLLKDFLPYHMGRRTRDYQGNKISTELYRWDIVEGLFLWKGKLVSAEQLKNAERRESE